MAMLEVEALVKDFPARRGLRATLRQPFANPQVRILNGVDLRVEQGEVLGILGSNGAGKTTLLKIVASFIVPTSGHVKVDGYDVVRHPGAARAIAAYCFAEDRSFYWRLSGKENLEFCAALDNLHGKEADRLIGETAERLGVSAYLDQPYAVFSAGIRQRFALARALLRRPRVLLLDEPTRSVDPAEAKRIWAFLRGTLVEEQGMTIVLVTHNVEEAVAVCDGIAVLEKGRLRASLKPREISEAADGMHGLTLTLTGFRRSELPRLKLIAGVKDVLMSEQGGEQQLEVTCDNGDMSIAEVVALTTGSGARLQSLVQGVPVHEFVNRLVKNGAQN